SSHYQFDVPKREEVDPFSFSDFAETSMGLRNSRNALMPKIADIASRISDMNRLSTVSANPWERIHAMPSSGMIANTMEMIKSIGFVADFQPSLACATPTFN